jgi:hypothetical protein
MRRVLFGVLLLAGCKKEQQAAPTKGSAAPVAGDAAVATADSAAAAAPPAAINLLDSVPATVRVSSTVNNPKILPNHIVDKSLDTAWNSVTGQLVGAWIEVSVDNAQIEQVKFTVGHTGTGPKGQDYFTMNPRIAEVAVTDDGKPIGTFPMDISDRGLQTIAEQPKGTLRITVTKIQPGSKKNWREVAISELEVWGTPAAGWKKPSGALEPYVAVFGEPEKAPDPCAGIEEERDKQIKAGVYDQCNGSTDPGCSDHNYPPKCGELEVPANASQLSAPWSSFAAACPIGDEIYGPKDCLLSFRSGNHTATIEVPGPGGGSGPLGDIAVTSLKEADVVPGGDRELVVRFQRDSEERVFVCAVSPTFGCAGPFDTKDDAALKTAAAAATFGDVSWPE